MAQTLREANQMALKDKICSLILSHTSFSNHNDRCLSRHQTFCTSNLGYCCWKSLYLSTKHHWLYQLLTWYRKYFLWMFISQSVLAKVLTFCSHFSQLGTFCEHTCFACIFLDSYFWAALYLQKVTHYWFEWAWCRQSNIWGLNSVELIQLSSL